MFQRLQVNTSGALSDSQVNVLCNWACWLNAEPILQCRDSFPADERVTWLFDASGGRGIAPEHWPDDGPHDPRLIGYAGGIGPANVRSVVEAIQAPVYYLDMESKIRTDEVFDLEKCSAVCEQIWGKP